MCRGGCGCSVTVVLVLVRPVPAHPPPPVIAPLEHVGRRHRVQRPIAALAATHIVVHAGPAPGYLDETVVQAQVVPDRVLPALPVPPVIRELLRDVAVDLAQRHPLVGRRRDGHRDQRYIRVRRLLVAPGRGHVRGGYRRGRGRRGRSGRRVLLGPRLLEQAARRHLLTDARIKQRLLLGNTQTRVCCNNSCVDPGLSRFPRIENKMLRDLGPPPFYSCF